MPSPDEGSTPIEGRSPSRLWRTAESSLGWVLPTSSLLVPVVVPLLDIPSFSALADDRTARATGAGKLRGR